MAVVGATAVIVSPTHVPGVFTFEPCMVKPSAVEIASMVPFEIRAIVFIVDPVAVVAIPYGVVIVNIPGEFVLIDNGAGSGRIAIAVLAVSVLVVLILIYRSGSGILLIYYGGRGRCAHIYPDSGNAETSVDIYLGIGRAGDEGTCEDRSKNKQLFHFRRF